MPRILLHSCCGPCTLYPLQKLREGNWVVHPFFYNPFIQPYQELSRRIEAFEQVVEKTSARAILRKDYDLEGFFREVVFRESRRCHYCYSVRLNAAARTAKKSRMDAFTTTLLYSKHQNHELICSIAQEASIRNGIPFHYEDFRLGRAEGQSRARSLGIYRQQYCGCIYSEKERFTPRDDPGPEEGKE
ncbi:MAG TPA: epoxyqueuosine reductase QueH [Syntrophobacteraceae bacterium]|nr:epoxyqueuosine reductase QueH [Syntrophobacteraceae bacterium]